MNSPNRRLDIAMILWQRLAMPIFVERFVLPSLAAVLILLLATNPMGFDSIQRISGSVAVISVAFFCAYSLHVYGKKPNLGDQPVQPAPTNAPKFKISILGGFTAPANLGKNSVGVQMGVRIVNTGATGVMANWRLDARLADNSVLSSLPAAVVDNPSKVATPFGWPDLNTTKVKIDADSMENGELYFVFDFQAITFDRETITLYLTAEDVFGNTYTAIQPLREWIKKN